MTRPVTYPVESPIKGVLVGVISGATTVADGALLGSEILTSFDLTSGWTAGETGTIVDSDSFTTTGVGGAFKVGSMVTGKKYQIIIDGVTDTDFRVTDAAVSAVYLTGFGTAEFVAGHTSLYLRNYSGGATDISGISLREVIPT